MLLDDVEIAIQPNLYFGISHMLDEIIKSRLPIFVDALCIDQQNHTERAIQVQLMRSIYENAAQVWAWLGLPKSDREAELACQAIMSFDDTKIDMKDEDRNRWLALLTLLEEEYWQRTWIYLEITGPAITRAWYGRHTFEFDRILHLGRLTLFLSDYDSLQRSLMSALFVGSPVAQLHMIQQSRRAPEVYTIMYWLDTMRYTRCSDLRDKFFAPKLLVQDNTWNWLKPDYKKSIRQVYVECAKYLVHESDLELLGMQGYQGSKMSTLTPSWVPDWSLAAASIASLHALGFHAAGLGAQPKPTVTAEMLVTYGKRVDVVTFRGEDNRESSARYLQAYAPLKANKPYLATGESARAAFLRTIAMDCTYSTDEGGSLRRWGTVDWSIYDADDNEPEQRKFTRVMFDAFCKGRVYGTTDAGYMGMFPAACRVDDLIVVLATGEVPYVLRPIEGDRFTFVGECYVHGIMDGEAMGDGQDLEKFVLV